ncbi:MAG: transposase [Solirubrobacterales bacterium]
MERRAKDPTRRDKNRPNATYHLTAHGVDELPIFGKYSEKRTFINLFERYLSHAPSSDAKGRRSRKLHHAVNLIAFCVMDNHLHLIVHQRTADGCEQLMHSLMTSYAKWFNNENNRRGPILRERYAATPILTHEHAKQAIAYVHLNEPTQGLNYEHTGHDYLIGARRADWIDVDAGLRIFGGRTAYLDYLTRHGPAIIKRKRTKATLK